MKPSTADNRGDGRVRVKICGITRAEDARCAARLGADYLGLVCAESPRRLDLSRADWIAEVRAEFPSVQWVGVFVRPDAAELADLTARLGLDLVQLHDPHPASVPRDLPWILATRPGAAVGAPTSSDSPTAGDAAPSTAALRTPTPPAEALPFGDAPGAGRPGEPWALLVDTPDPALAGGTGRTFDWSGISGWSSEVRLFLAGGLAADNVGAAIAQVRPFAVDASSRLERAPGIKDPDELAAFFEAVRTASASLGGSSC
jgi:phosphoribosylanthranilate isomerase